MLSVSSYPALHVLCNTYVCNKYYLARALGVLEVFSYMEDWLAAELQWPAKPSCLLHIVNATSLVLWPQIGYIIEIPWCNQVTSLMHPCNWFGAEGWPLYSAQDWCPTDGHGFR